MGAQKVVVADVLITRHIHYLDREEVGDLTLANPPCSGVLLHANTACTQGVPGHSLALALAQGSTDTCR